jgi:acetyl-CoA carboxylase biotin carboxylase subunit
LLIANRGEIALRVAHACRDLGVEPVIVHSEADRDAPWLDEAEVAVCVGPASAGASYLNQDAVLQAAEMTDCQAVHPGYGFLSENATFATRVMQHGLAFVGPTPGAIRRMGDKAAAKQAMADAGVPTIPGSRGIVASVSEASELANTMGYPVLLKASAGGGGKGMRLCRNAGELETGFVEASLEAEKAFGNAALYLEKYLEGGRHVEFQVLADRFGAALHLGERECSIQRSHQKLIEESPSPVVDEATRSRLGDLVAGAVAGVGYRNAGTIEFLRDAEGHYYFMEMNTRLQVEHPVTELITGIDIVAEQIRIAANVPLGMAQAEVEFRGHAIEFRINAENPDDGFRPDPGVITGFEAGRVDADDITVRWDSAVREGYRIPPHYDSMIGKLIVHGPTRSRAIEGAREALRSLRIEGVHTTTGLHLRLLEDEGFVEGRYDVNHLAATGLVTSADGD